MSRVVLGLASLIFLLPAGLLSIGPKPALFGFQMYSGYGELSASWTDAAGSTHHVVLSEHLASPRREIDWTTILPVQLCNDLPTATSVEVRQTARGGDRAVVWQCER